MVGLYAADRLTGADTALLVVRVPSVKPPFGSPAEGVSATA